MADHRPTLGTLTWPSIEQVQRGVDLGQQLLDLFPLVRARVLFQAFEQFTLLGPKPCHGRRHFGFSLIGKQNPAGLSSGGHGRQTNGMGALGSRVFQTDAGPIETVSPRSSNGNVDAGGTSPPPRIRAIDAQHSGSKLRLEDSTRTSSADVAPPEQP